MEVGCKETPRPLYLRVRDKLPIAQEAGLALGPFWMGAENFTHQGSNAGASSTKTVTIPTRYANLNMYQLKLRTENWIPNFNEIQVPKLHIPSLTQSIKMYRISSFDT
jgi:hypothetical protein